MQVAFFQFSPRLIGEKLWKIEVLFSGINCLKTVVKKWKLKTEVLISFYVIKDIVHFEFIPQGQTVNRAYYMEILKRLCVAVHRKGLNFGPSIGLSTMTMLQFRRRSLSSSLWLINPLLRRNTHPITMIWFLMTSDCFQKYSLPQRDEDFRILKTSKKMWQRHWKLFHNMVKVKLSLCFF